jgi:hypothetical protein
MCARASARPHARTTCRMCRLRGCPLLYGAVRHPRPPHRCTSLAARTHAQGGHHSIVVANCHESVRRWALSATGHAVPVGATGAPLPLPLGAHAAEPAPTRPAALDAAACSSWACVTACEEVGWGAGSDDSAFTDVVAAGAADAAAGPESDGGSGGGAADPDAGCDAGSGSRHRAAALSDAGSPAEAEEARTSELLTGCGHAGPRMFLATQPAAAGVLQGLAAFGFL